LSVKINGSRASSTVSTNRNRFTHKERARASPQFLALKFYGISLSRFWRNLMSKLDSFPSKLFLRNGALLILPPMIISFGLWSELPSAYAPQQFWKEIPVWLGLFENIFRIIVSCLPAFLYFGKKEHSQFIGWILYFIGLLLYLFSYLLQIYLPNSFWSQSVIGFTAPAWTTLFWLFGISLVCARSWLPIPWNRLIYISCVIIFLVFHIWHNSLVFIRLIH
jgi:hypothetical protein